MEKMNTLFLKFALFIIGLPVLALCIFAVPEIGKAATQLLEGVPGINWMMMLLFYASAVAFYVALYQAFQLLRYIDRNDAFSYLSVTALKRIKYCAISISILHACTLPLFYAFAEYDDAPGVIIVGLVVPFASLVIAVFAAVLHRLLQQAIEIKSENDLMI